MLHPYGVLNLNLKRRVTSEVSALMSDCVSAVGTVPVREQLPRRSYSIHPIQFDELINCIMHIFATSCEITTNPMAQRTKWKDRSIIDNVSFVDHGLNGHRLCWDIDGSG